MAAAPAESTCSHSGIFTCGPARLTTAITSGARARRWRSASICSDFASGYLYQIPERVTLRRFPSSCESDSTWRTKEVRHVGCDSITWGFFCEAIVQLCQEDQGWPASKTIVGAGSNL